jgi:very-short-patch-repair endonuclease
LIVAPDLCLDSADGERLGALRPSDELRAAGARQTGRAREVAMPARHKHSAHALLEERARQNRFSLTRSEQQLWRALCAGQLSVAFRRQVVIGGRFIADFVAPKAWLIVEVHGAYHTRRQRADARRDAFLRRCGYRVLRLDAELVMRDLAAAVAAVRAALGE